VTNTCDKCKSVKYCNTLCKKKHKKKHKIECEKRVAELQSKQKDQDYIGDEKTAHANANNNTDNQSKQALQMQDEAWTSDVLKLAYQSIDQSIDEAWQRVSMFILGEELIRDSTRAGDHLRDSLHILLNTVKNGCCSNVGPGYMCGHCESSMNVIRISRAVILSICKLPIELNDDITRIELNRMRSWVYNQVQEFSGSAKEIQMALPQKLSKLIIDAFGIPNSQSLIESSSTDSIPPWGEDDFALLLQRPSTGWFMQTNVLMTMGYRVVLVNFSDVARYAKRNLKVVYEDISLLLCPQPTEDDKVHELNEAMDKSCTIENRSEQVQAVDDKDGSHIASPPSHAVNNDTAYDISGGAEQVTESPKKLRKRAKKKLKKREKQALLKQHDEALFKQPPPNDECPICFLQFPTLETGSTYLSCCGRVICSGCAHAPFHDANGNVVTEEPCPFCRTPDPATDDEAVERLNKRVEVGDAIAIYTLGLHYTNGEIGLPIHNEKALELWHKAGELGYAAAYYRIGMAYDIGDGVKMDGEKTRHYYELAAIGGHAGARYILGNMEKKAGNNDKALKHYTIAVKSGHTSVNEYYRDGSLEAIEGLYEEGNATKEDYDEAREAHRAYMEEIRSVQRDKAAEKSSYQKFRYY